MLTTRDADASFANASAGLTDRSRFGINRRQLLCIRAGARTDPEMAMGQSCVSNRFERLLRNGLRAGKERCGWNKCSFERLGKGAFVPHNISRFCLGC